MCDGSVYLWHDGRIRFSDNRRTKGCCGKMDGGSQGKTESDSACRWHVAGSVCFFKPGSVDELIGFFKPIAASASRLPFYYYNMPSITGVSLPVHKFLIEGKKQIPNLVGVKFTHNNLMEMQQCIHADGGAFEVLHGFDEILITGLSVGAKAAVGSTYNYVPGIYKAVMEAMEKGDLETAREMQWKSVEIIDVLIKHGGGVRAGKIFMKLAGIDCGPCRLPIAPCSEEELEETRNELKNTEFFKYIN